MTAANPGKPPALPAVSMPELSDGFVLRVAALPLDEMYAFGDPELPQLAGSDTDAGMRTYHETYARALARDRETLRTLATRPDVASALALSSPDALAEAGRALLLRGEKRQRRVDATLYRYVARACGRAQPEGLWAGVAAGEWGVDTTVATVSKRVHVTPELAHFRALLRDLVRRDEYKYAGDWVVTPTLAPTKDGWEFWALADDGAARHRHLASNPLLATVLHVLADLGPARWTDLLRSSITAAPCEAAAVSAMLDALARGGVLVGGLDLPDHVAEPWSALDTVPEALLPTDAAVWRGSVSRLREVASRLTTALEHGAYDVVPVILRDGTVLVTDLTHRLGLSALPAPSSAVLRVDLVAPWHVVLGPELREALALAVAEYDAVQEAVGVGQALVRAITRIDVGGRVGAVAAQLPTPPDLATAVTWEDVIDAVPANSPDDARRRLHAWVSMLGADSAEQVLAPGHPPVDSAPLGCLLVELAEPELVLRGVSDQPGQAYVRHLPALHVGGERIRSWLGEQLADLASTSGIELLHLRGPYARNPNVALTPDVGRPTTRVWGAGPTMVNLCGARVVPDGGCTLLEVPGLDRPAAVFALGSADLARGDPVTDLLLRTFFHVPASQFYAADLAVRAETGAPCPSPRVRLAGGAVVRLRRTVLSPAQVSGVLAVRGSERFRRWQRLAVAYNWPPTLRVRRRSEPPLLVRRDSPVAVEAALRSLDPNTPLVIEEMPEPWLLDQCGRRYVAEVVVPFRRQVHAWTHNTSKPVTP